MVICPTVNQHLMLVTHHQGAAIWNQESINALTQPTVSYDTEEVIASLLVLSALISVDIIFSSQFCQLHMTLALHCTLWWIYHVFVCDVLVTVNFASLWHYYYYYHQCCYWIMSFLSVHNRMESIFEMKRKVNGCHILLVKPRCAAQAINSNW